MAQYELSLADYWRILRKRMWIVIGSVMVLMLTAGSYLQQRVLLYRAVATIKLEKSQALPGNLFGGFQSYYQNPMVTESRVIESRAVAGAVARQIDPTRESDDPLAFEALVDEIHDSITAEPIPETNIIQIIATTSDPRQAAQFASLTAEAYMTFNVQEKNRQARKVREFVEAELAQTELRLEAAEEQLTRMREEGTATGIGPALQSRVLDTETRLATLLPKFTEAHPDVIRLKEQLAKLQAQLRTLPKAEMEFARLTRDAQVNEKAYRTLRERLEQARLAEAEKIADASIIERATVPGGPISPRKRLGLAMGGVLGILVGCVLAFVVETLDTSIGTIEDVEGLLGVPVLAVIPHIGREQRPRNRWLRWELPEVAWRIPWLSEKLKTREAAMRLHAHYQVRSVTTEAYRILRTNLKFSPERKTILITSTGPREGKTEVVSNLGVVTAQSGARTMLVTADLRRPELDQIFGFSKEAGLTECLRGESTLEEVTRGLSDFILGKLGYDEVVKHPYLANLFLLTPGRHLPENPVELVASKAMEELLAKVKAQYDTVLIDGPPILPVADSLLIAPHVDGVVLVYQVGRISRAALLRAKTQLASSGGKLLGVVLNHVQPEVQTTPTYYYYRERYGYTPEEPSAQMAPKAKG